MYSIGPKLPKRDKLGIHTTIEKRTVDLLTLAVTAAFQSHQTKRPTLETLRVRTDVLKHLVRSEHELGVIHEDAYLRLSEQLIEISKQTNLWLASLTQKGISRG